jgi:hypothetical protein
LVVYPWREWICAGGRVGGDGSTAEQGQWDIRPIYRSLAAAYGWTYSEIDSHTLFEVKELFSGWSDHPPTNILVRAIVEGLGGGKASVASEDDFSVPQVAQDAMQRAATAAIAAKAGSRLPVIHGKDTGLPKAAPVFDLDILREKNIELLKKRRAEKGKERVG